MLDRLTSFVATYPYFVSALLVLILYLIGMALSPRHRRGALASGLLAIPWGALWAVALVPDYWRPRLIAHLGDVGLEDFVWAFSTGGLAWLSAVVPGNRELTLKTDFVASSRRFVIISLVGPASFVPLWLGGFRVMVAFLVSAVVLGVFLGCVRRDVWKLAVWGALGFGLINFLVMKTIVALQPEYFSQMTPGALSGVRLSGLPIEELYWAVATGAVLPLALCYVLDAQEDTGTGSA